MTTCVKVDAHAGWDVEVKVADKTEFGWVVRHEIVKKHTERVFYVHSTTDIWGVREIQPDTN
jgi:hypothetical protein